MTNPYYNPSGSPAPFSQGSSAAMRNELANIALGFDKMPTLTANRMIFVNAGGTALEPRSQIDGISIGAVTPAPGTFTTLQADDDAQFNAELIQEAAAAVPRTRFTRTGVASWYVGGPASGSGQDFEISLNAVAPAFLGINTNGEMGFGAAPLASSGIRALFQGDSAQIRLRNASATRYRADLKVDSTALLLNAYDDTGAAYRPIHMDALQWRLNTGTGAGVTAIYVDENSAVGVRRTSLRSPTVLKFQVGDGTSDTRALFTNDGAFALGVSSAGSGSNAIYYLGASAHASQADLIFSNDGGTERLRLTYDGRLYGTALHNNAGSVSGTATQFIASGTYTPSATVGANVSAPGDLTPSAFCWTRVGNTVVVSGQIGVDPASTNTDTSFQISLPINRSSAGPGGGTSCGVYSGIMCAGRVSVSLTTATITFRTGADAGGATHGVIFSYEIN